MGIVSRRQNLIVFLAFFKIPIMVMAKDSLHMEIMVSLNDLQISV